MLRDMRSTFLFAGLFMLWGGPAAAGPLSACDFITQAEVEKMLGEKVGPPMVTDGGICAGVCASLDNSPLRFLPLLAKERRRSSISTSCCRPMSSPPSRAGDDGIR